MNFIDQLLMKVGKQTLLTSQAMLNGELTNDDYAELERLRGIEFTVNPSLFSMFIRKLQNASNGNASPMVSGLKNNDDVYSLINKLSKVEEKFIVSTIYSDLSRLVEFNNILLSEKDISQETLNTAALMIYTKVPRFSIFPTRPLITGTIIPTFISDKPKEDTNGEDFIKFLLKHEVFADIDGVLEADRASWNEEHENHEPNKHKELHTIIYKFLTIEHPTKLLEFAQSVFEPQNIHDVAGRSFTSTHIGLLDGVRDNLLKTIDANIEKHGFIDYRFMLVSMFITSIRFGLDKDA